jgi:signal transduction histidine kinase/CheY-like chemotaxis protein
MPNETGNRPTTSATGQNYQISPLVLNQELLSHAYAQQTSALPANLSLSLLTVIIMWPKAPAPILISWLTVIWLITGFRYLLYRVYQRAVPSEQSDRRWKKLFLIGLMATGVAWGSAGLLMFTGESPAHQVVLAFVLGGIVAGTTTSLAALQVPLRIFIGLLMIPIAARFMLADDTVSLILGLMLLLYGVLCAAMSTNIYKILHSAITLKHQNLEEIETRQKAESALNHYKNNLERLFLERTRDLARANEKLSREIIERQKAEEEKERIAEELLHAQKIEAIGTLAGGIAHDFNNILSIILGFTELALDELPPGADQSDLQEVFKAVNRGKNLVKQILEFSRNDPQQPESFLVQELINELKPLLRATIPTTVEIRTDLDPDCGPILVDPHQLQRVLANLAANGVQAMEERGTLTLSLKEIELAPNERPPQTGLSAGAYARISVTDTGCGIAPDLKKRIFEPFFTTKEVGKGTGMGLAVVHGIVTSNHGMIEVDSEPGVGTTFHLFFPITSEEISKPAPVSAVAQKGRERIMVVDDEPTIVSLIERLLSSQGYTVTACTSGGEALEIIRSAPDSFDLVITDQTMPDLTGLELAEELRKLREDLPVILCTGYSSRIIPENIERAGIKTVMMKPVQLQELTRSIRSLLDKAESAPEP